MAGGSCDVSMQAIVHDPLTTATNEETYLLRFSRNSEAFASDFLENLEELIRPEGNN